MNAIKTIFKSNLLARILAKVSAPEDMTLAVWFVHAATASHKLFGLRG